MSFRFNLSVGTCVGTEHCEPSDMHFIWREVAPGRTLSSSDTTLTIVARWREREKKGKRRLLS